MQECRPSHLSLFKPPTRDLEGFVLAGISAGSICWFEEGVADSYGDKLEPLQCLGFLKGSNCPHYYGEADRRPVYQEMVASGVLKPGIAADDGVAVHYVEQELKTEYLGG